MCLCGRVVLFSSVGSLLEGSAFHKSAPLRRKAKGCGCTEPKSPGLPVPTAPAEALAEAPMPMVAAKAKASNRTPKPDV